MSELAQEGWGLQKLIRLEHSFQHEAWPVASECISFFVYEACGIKLREQEIAILYMTLFARVYQICHGEELLKRELHKKKREEGRIRFESIIAKTSSLQALHDDALGADEQSRLLILDLARELRDSSLTDYCIRQMESPFSSESDSPGAIGLNVLDNLRGASGLVSDIYPIRLSSKEVDDLYLDLTERGYSIRNMMPSSYSSWPDYQLRIESYRALLGNEIDTPQKIAVMLTMLLIPSAIAEDLKRNLQLLEGAKGVNLKFICTAQSVHTSILFRLISVFLKREHNIPLISLQHGGTYGSGRYCYEEMIECSASDIFVSWGWRESKYTDAVRVGAFMGGRVCLDKDRLKHGNMVFVVNHARDEPFCLHIADNPLRAKNSAKETIAIIQGLSDLPRFYVKTLGIGSNKKLSQILSARPYRYIQPSVSSFYSRIHTCRLVILSHFGTTALECLHTNTPFVVLETDGLNVFREIYSHAFESLIQESILHLSVESLVMHIRTTEGRIDSWWERNETQHARMAARYLFASSTKGLSESLMEIFERF